MSHNDNCWVLTRPLEQCGRGLNHVTKSSFLEFPGALQSLGSRLQHLSQVGKHIHVTQLFTALIPRAVCPSSSCLSPTLLKAATGSLPPQRHKGPAWTPLPAVANVPPVAGDRAQWQLSALQCSTERELEVARHTKAWPFPLIWLPFFPGTC